MYDTLVTHLNGDVTDVCAVVAHEIGHAKLHHNYMMLLQASFQIFITFFTYGLCSSDPALVTDFGYEGACTYLKVQTFLTLYNSAVSPVLGPLNSAFTRALEFSVCPRPPAPSPCRAAPPPLASPYSHSHRVHTTFTPHSHVALPCRPSASREFSHSHRVHTTFTPHSHVALPCRSSTSRESAVPHPLPPWLPARDPRLLPPSPAAVDAWRRPIATPSASATGRICATR